MRITLIYDNEVYKEGLEADWGFSCLVEAENKKILFDTGASGRILLSNMEKLKIEPSSIDEVFISHPHFDHTGGLSDFLDKNRDVKIYVPSSFKENLNAKEVIYVKEKIKLHESLFSTGELEGIEQSLCVKTEKGIVVIVGCSHPKLENILKVASQFGKVYALIGGLHGFKDFDLLNDLKLVCPCHCTQHKLEIKSLYSEKYVEGGAGKIIEI